MMAMIELTRGFSAVIDDADLPSVAQFKWHVFTTGRTAYARANAAGFMHRLLLQASKGSTVDHINGDGLDNRRENLRLCTHAENSRNQRKRLNQTTSRSKGVSASRESFRAAIVTRQVVRSISLPTEYEAAMAYDVMAMATYGSFAKTNFTPEEHLRYQKSFPNFWPLVQAKLQFLEARDTYEGRVTKSGKVIEGERQALAAYLGESHD